MGMRGMAISSAQLVLISRRLAFKSNYSHRPFWDYVYQYGGRYGNKCYAFYSVTSILSLSQPSFGHPVSQSMSPLCAYDISMYIPPLTIGRHHHNHHHPPVSPFSLHSSEIARQSSKAIHLNKENCLRVVINGKKLLYN